MAIPNWRQALLDQYGPTFTPAQCRVLRDGPSSMATAYFLGHLYKKYGHLVEDKAEPVDFW